MRRAVNRTAYGILGIAALAASLGARAGDTRIVVAGSAVTCFATLAAVVTS